MFVIFNDVNEVFGERVDKEFAFVRDLGERCRSDYIGHVRNNGKSFEVFKLQT